MEKEILLEKDQVELAGFNLDNSQNSLFTRYKKAVLWCCLAIWTVIIGGNFDCQAKLEASDRIKKKVGQILTENQDKKDFSVFKNLPSLNIYPEKLVENLEGEEEVVYRVSGWKTLTKEEASVVKVWFYEGREPLGVSIDYGEEHFAFNKYINPELLKARYKVHIGLVN